MTDHSDLARRLHVADADVRAVNWVDGECYVTLADGTVNVLLERGYKVVFGVPEPALTSVSVPDGNVTTVIDWVAGDQLRARQALDEELLRDRPRKGLVAYLGRVVT